MDPISTTYSANSYSSPYTERTSPLPASSADKALTTQQPTEKLYDKFPQAVEVQLGKNASNTEKQEFKPYNSEGRTTDPITNKKTAAAKDAQTALPGQAKKDDPQTQQIVSQLKAIEEKVKAHEAAHKSSGAATGPISYTYTRGPDGKSYITGGEVPINISSGSTPQETVGRMQQVIQAALAPADPSPQDRAVAAQAENIKMQAQQEQTKQATQQIGDNKNSEAQTGAAQDASTAAQSTTDIKKTDSGDQPEQKAGDRKNSSISQLFHSTYTDPAVTGKSDSAQKTAERTDQRNAIDAAIRITQQAGSRQPSAGITTSMISGFASSGPVSFYA